ncbi:MAG: hypothetical protein ALMCE001_07470 [Methanocorpusculum sp. MCE]|nr:MAG: hypothetical protein ALMCE001_07470 [Methanocorpusculum sp. MCE]
MGTFVGKFRIHLVRDQQKIVIDDDIGDRLEIVFAHYTPGRIVREVDDQRFAVRRDLFHKCVGRDLELILRIAGKSDRFSACHKHFGFVGDKTGIDNDHFIAGIHDGSNGNIETFRYAGRHNDLARGVRSMIPLLQIFGKS